MSDEQWLPVPGFEALYEVSDAGRVRSVTRMIDTCGRDKKTWVKRLYIGRVLGLCRTHQYDRVSLKSKHYLVHRFVALAFIPNPNNYPHVNHIDGNKKNNAASNLEWCTHEMNMKHANENNLMNPKYPVHAHLDGYGFWFPSLQSTRRYGCNPSLVHSAINGRQKSHRGFSWEYALPADSEYQKLKEKQDE